MGSPLNRSDVQALILEPYRFPISRHVFFSSGNDNKTGARQFLSEWTPRVTHGSSDLSISPERVLFNIGVTWTGLVKLGAFDDLGGAEAAEKAFFWDFRKPPDPNSLRAYGSSVPANWWNKKFASSDIELVLHIYSTTDAALDSFTGALQTSAHANRMLGLTPTKDGGAITGRAISGRKLHFGYQDGISYPPVNWDDLPSRPDLYHRGNFLLGEWLENAQSFPKDRPFSDFVRNGTYMAFMWIYQDVAAFNRFLREKGSQIAGRLNLAQRDAEEWLAAKMMGRWRDGTPLALSPSRPDADLTMANDFGYADDPQGVKCPVAAHIRLTNGRDQPLNDANASMFPAGFPRVLRRGTPYGPPLEGEHDDNRDRGTVGMFLCANLNNQFYSLTRWIGKTDFSDAYTDNRGQDARGRNEPRRGLEQ